MKKFQENGKIFKINKKPEKTRKIKKLQEKFDGDKNFQGRNKKIQED